MDMAFITKFIADENKQFVIENITAVFDDAIIENVKLKRDVAIIINAMIMKTFTSETKQEELRGRIGMKEYENEMERIVYEEYGDELRKKDNEIVKLHDKNNELNDRNHELNDRNHELNDRNDKLNDINNELNNENKKYKDNIEELKKFDDFNSAEAKKIIHALMVI